MPVESREPQNEGTLTGAFREVLGKLIQRTDDLLPASVVAYDRALNRATVQPLIQVVDTDGNFINRAQKTNVPVLVLGGGGFLVSFDLPAGSLGWIKANDRDISLFLQEYSLQPPNTKRMHSFEDGLFIPDIMRDYSIASEDEQAAVIQSTDGSVKISLTAERIKLTGPAIEIMGPTSITGNTTITGNADISGTIMNGSLNLTTHNHTQPNDSNGNTEMPTSGPQ